MGGDELFWGYPRFLTTMDYKKIGLYPKLFRKLYAAFYEDLLEKEFHLESIIKQLVIGFFRGKVLITHIL